MRILSRITLAFLCLLIFAAPMQAGEVDDAIQALKQANDGTRAEAANRVIDLGPQALDALFALMGGEDHGADRAAHFAAEKIAFAAARPGAETERLAAERILVKTALSDQPLEPRLFAIRLLSYIGHDEAVDALGQLLKDRDCQEMARWALVRIPGGKSIQALAGVLDASSGRFRAGLLQALAANADDHILSVIRASVKDQDKEVRWAAIEALGRAGDASDAELLYPILTGKDGVDKKRAVEAWRALADRLADEGKERAAHGLFVKLLPEAFYEYNSGPAPREAEIAALVGIGKTGGRADLATLMEALTSDSADYRTAAQRGLVFLKYDSAGAIARALPDAEQPSQRLMVQVLKERKGSSSAAALRKSLHVDDPIVKVDILRALAQYESVRDVPVFLSAMKEPAPVGDAARGLLVTLDGKNVTAALLKAYKVAPESEKPGLLKLLGDRKDSRTLPVIEGGISSGSPALREAALHGLRNQREKAALPFLFDSLESGDAEVRQAAEAALGFYHDTATLEAITTRLDRSGDEALGSLLRVLASNGEGKFASTLVSYSRDKRQAVRTAALSGLYQYPDEAGLPVFREAADSAEPEVRKEGINGIVAVARKIAGTDEGKALALLKEGIGKGQTADEKKPALEALGAIRQAGALELIRSYLNDKDLREAACRAIYTQGDAIRREDRNAARELYREVAVQSGDPGTAQAALGQLEAMGGDVNMADYGVVTRWHISGPFKDGKALSNIKDLPSGKEIDTRKPLTIRGESQEWKEAEARNARGQVNLKDVCGPLDDGGAYMYTTFESSRAMKGKILTGSDDGIAIWLNGELLYEKDGKRGFRPATDVVDASFVKGTNMLVLRVVQDGGDWMGGARIVGEDGRGMGLE